MQRLTRRQDFIAAAKAATQGTPGFLVQARKRDDDAPANLVERRLL